MSEEKLIVNSAIPMTKLPQFSFLMGAHLPMFRVCFQGLLLVVLRRQYETGDQSLDSCLQDKHPIHCTIAPALFNKF